MFDVTAGKHPNHDHLAAFAAWARQMHAALKRPVQHDLIAGNRDFARMVDRGISQIRASSLDPRI